MVDLGELDKMRDKGSSKGKKKDKGESKNSNSQQTQSTSGSGGSGGSGGVHSLDDGDMVSPDGKHVSGVSKEWASDKGELNTDAHSGEGLKSYMNRQVKEVEELHGNIEEMARNNNENFDEFTLYMHAMFLNFGQNRVGIMEEIQSQFGKSKSEAYELTNRICQQAGEKEFMEQIVRDITENLADF